MSQFYSILHQQKFYKIRYPTSQNRPNKYNTPKLKIHDLHKSKQVAQNIHKIPYEFPVKNFEILSQASKSQTFIHPHSRLSLSRLQKDRVSLKKTGSKYTDWKHVKQMKDQQKIQSQLSEHCERSLQQLLAPKPNNYKTQYSKITRRKQTIIKRNLVIEDNERIEPKKGKNQVISQQKLIQKYRQLIQQTKPLNLINRLFQNDILLTKLMPLSTKQRLIISNLTKNQRQIEDKISKIVSRPSQYDTIRKMLLSIHDKIEEKAQYPYQTKDPLTKNQSELIDTRSNDKFLSLQGQKKEQYRKSFAAPFTRNRENKFKPKDEPASLPKKIQSDTHISPPVQKDIFPPPKRLTCNAYIIYEVPTVNKQKHLKKVSVELPKKKQYQSNLHCGANIKIASEIASLTKIMTCIIVIEICQRLSIDPFNEKHKIGTFESFIRGTSAELEPGQIYSIHELLHGLMLPSGNDASLALARWAGNVLLLSDQQGNKRTSVKSQLNMQFQPYFWALQNKFIRSQAQKLRPRRCYNRFIAQMNKRARLLNMQRTTYANSHGLSNNLNRSCCLDLAFLCQHAMQNDYFRQIVSCKEFSTTIDKEVTVTASMRPKASVKSNCLDPEEMNLEADAQDRQTDDRSECEQGEVKEQKIKLQKKEIKWINTHKLLHQRQQYIGIKTGVTVTAGPCLASWLKINERNFIIIVLNSKKLSQRFKDTQILRQWLSKKQKLKCSIASLKEGDKDSSSEDSS